MAVPVLASYRRGEGWPAEELEFDARSGCKHGIIKCLCNGAPFRFSSSQCGERFHRGTLDIVAAKLRDTARFLTAGGREAVYVVIDGVDSTCVSGARARLSMAGTDRHALGVGAYVKFFFSSTRQRCARSSRGAEYGWPTWLKSTTRRAA